MGDIFRGMVCPGCGSFNTIGITGGPKDPEIVWWCVQCENKWVLRKRDGRVTWT